jgi:hypothetical protein
MRKSSALIARLEDLLEHYLCQDLAEQANFIEACLFALYTQPPVNPLHWCQSTKDALHATFKVGADCPDFSFVLEIIEQVRVHFHYLLN